MGKIKVYNQLMRKSKLINLISFSLFMALPAFSPLMMADENNAEATIALQKETCDKNSAMEWSSKLNRCVAKADAFATRNETRACEGILDPLANQKCHLDLAEKNSGTSSNTKKLNQGNTTASLLMNSAAAAYAGTALILEEGKNEENSNCMSRKILGITALAGIASDIYLKVRAKKKVKELEGKYILDTKGTAYEAQVKALEYLKEEQQTVVSIASMEKKRNMLLMLGYGMASGWAIYEMTGMGANPSCIPKKQ